MALAYTQALTDLLNARKYDGLAPLLDEAELQARSCAPRAPRALR